jgi:hypothetical protein
VLRSIQRHEVAADAGHRAAAFGHLGRGVVRAAGAEIGVRCVDRRFPLAAACGAPAAAARRCAPGSRKARTRAPDGAGDHRGRELAVRGSRRRPCLVALADHAGARSPEVVELLLELVLDDARFSSTTKTSSRPSAKSRAPSAPAARACRPCRRACRSRLAAAASMPSASSAWQHVEPGLAGGDDAEARRGAVDAAVRSILLARAKASAARQLVASQPVSCSSGRRASGC